jgi:oligopeptide transport system substrate-binding protein
MKEANGLLNKEQRAAKLREAETLLVRDEVPILPIFFYQSIHFWRSNEIRGISYNILDEHPLHAIGRNKTPGGRASSRDLATAARADARSANPR